MLTEPELGMREVAVKCASTLAVLLAASACRATDAAPPAASADFEVLLSGSQSGEHRAGATLITNEEAWQAFWRRHSGWRIPPAPEPAVDFGVHSVIVLCAGDEPTGGWTLEARSIRHAQGELRVQAELRAPAADAMLAQVVTQPYQILLVPRTNGKVVLQLAQRRSTR